MTYIHALFLLLCKPIFLCQRFYFVIYELTFCLSSKAALRRELVEDARVYKGLRHAYRSMNTLKYVYLQIRSDTNFDTQDSNHG